MKWQIVTAVRVIVFVLAAGAAGAQTWTSTDVGDVGAAGSATLSGGIWTVRGSGANIWGTADAFQFLHTSSGSVASVVARVDGVTGPSTFAKAGVMVRNSLAANSATAILDVRPNGAIEFMVRTKTGQSMSFINGTSANVPVWLKLSWSGTTVTGWVSIDGDNWASLGPANVAVELGASPQAGLAVTSASRGKLALAQVGDLAMELPNPTSEWSSTDVGAVGLRGNAKQVNDTWTIQGAGANIWGDADAFHFVYRPVNNALATSVVVRVNDLQNTSPFAKAGVMLRSNLSAGAAAIILNVRPTGEVEFMQRMADGATMQYLAGTSVTLPAWLRLDMAFVSGNEQITARVSQDHVHWAALPQSITMGVQAQLLAGVAVTSQNTSRLNTAHVSGLSLLPGGWENMDIGRTGLVGNAAFDTTPPHSSWVVQGAGADIWGTADSFHFVDVGQEWKGEFFSRVVSIQAVNPFAKGGLVIRDGLAPFAASVILDTRPDGNIEFMARMCPGCQTTFLGTTKVTLPALLSLARNGSTFTATVTTGDSRTRVNLGSVVVTMAAPVQGFAVTSHDLSQLATVLFDNPGD